MIIIFDAPTYELTSSKYDGIFKDIPMSFTTEERLVDGTVTVVPVLTESLLKKIKELDPSGYCIYVFACSRNKRKLKQYDKWFLKYGTSASLLNASKMPDSEAADEIAAHLYMVVNALSAVLNLKATEEDDDDVNSGSGETTRESH
nr:MAG TPA: hypothetical protein [Caudoviricetes sp.]